MTDEDVKKLVTIVQKESPGDVSAEDMWEVLGRQVLGEQMKGASVRSVMRGDYRKPSIVSGDQVVSGVYLDKNTGEASQRLKRRHKNNIQFLGFRV